MRFRETVLKIQTDFASRDEDYSVGADESFLMTVESTSRSELPTRIDNYQMKRKFGQKA